MRGHDGKLGGRPSPLAPTRKLVTLEQDLLVLIVGFTFPMVSVLLDGGSTGSRTDRQSRSARQSTGPCLALATSGELSAEKPSCDSI